MRLQETSDEIVAAGGSLVALSVDRPEDTQELLRQLADDGDPLSFPVVCDPSRKAIKALGVFDAEHDIALPAILILDSQGRVRWKHVSESVMDRPEEEALVKALEALK